MEEDKRKENPKGKEKTSLEKKLPLVVEVIPGAAKQGVVKAYNFGDYDLKNDCRHFLDSVISSGDNSVEDSLIVDRIKKELDKGSVLVGDEKVEDKAAENYIRSEKTDDGLDYLYLPIRVVQPQEGGLVKKCYRF